MLKIITGCTMQTYSIEPRVKLKMLKVEISLKALLISVYFTERNYSVFKSPNSQLLQQLVEEE